MFGGKGNENEVEENKFDDETVERDFEKFCEDWDLDIEKIADMKEEDRDDYDDIKRRIVRVMKLGRLVYNADKETFIYFFKKPQGTGEEGKSIEIRMPEGPSLLMMDKYKKGQSIHMKNAVIANMIKMPIPYVSNMNPMDSKITDAVFSLFFVL